ncbi:MAG TPA: hypothetical protein PKD91_06810 [Bacteroidia bacterium]|nr:hypothetical protein [Bacteroidia bacterium]
MSYFKFPALICYLLVLFSCSNKTVTSNTSAWPENGVSKYWKDTDTLHKKLYCSERIFPSSYRVLDANNEELTKLLKREGPTPGSLSPDTIEISIPLPDGSWEEFKIKQVSVMAPELAAKYPDIKTYSGKSKIYLSDNIRLDLSSQGVRVMIQSTRGTMMIDPYCNNDHVHVISYFRKNLPPNAKEDFER